MPRSYAVDRVLEGVALGGSSVIVSTFSSGPKDK
jgi:hypothetical protein